MIINKTSIDASKQVEAYFSIDARDRLFSTLKKLKFTNEDLSDILNISEEIEQHPLSETFYNIIIMSRENGFEFSNFVFMTYLEKCKLSIKALFRLFNDTPDLTDKNKFDWINYVTYHYPYWFADSYDTLETNLFVQPLNKLIANNLMEFVKNNDVSRLLIEIFQTLTDEDFDTILEKNLSYFKSPYYIAFFLAQCKNSTKKSLENTCKILKNIEDKMLIGLHKNCPTAIKLELYDKTKDERLVPKTVASFFII